MKKTIIKTIFFAMLLVIAVFSIASCTTDENSGDHVHDFQQKWDETHHFEECRCGEITGRAEHTFGWVVDTEPTYSAPGYKHNKCQVCGYKTDESTKIERLLHGEVLNEGMIDLSAYTQKSFKSKYGISNFLNDNQDKIDGICLSLDMSKVLYRRIYAQSSSNQPTYTFGYNGVEDSKYNDYYLKTYYKLYSEELGTDTEIGSSHSLTVCFVSYGGYDKFGDLSFEFYKYNETESIWNYLVRILDGEKCIAEMYYSTVLDIDREWIVSFLSESISEFSKNVETDTREELNEAFDIIREDGEKNNKLQLFVEYEDVHYELKNSGLYEDCEWRNSCFIINVECNYKNAVNEDWYKQCSQTDIESLNAAFYSCYGSGFPNGEYSNIVFAPGMYFIYYSLDDFKFDYSALKALTDLEYVTDVFISYQFGIPYDYIIR